MRVMIMATSPKPLQYLWAVLYLDVNQQLLADQYSSEFRVFLISVPGLPFRAQLPIFSKDLLYFIL